ncbi:phage major capsid protein [Priestia megaterium]
MKFTGKIKNSRGEIVELKNGSELRTAMKDSAGKDGRIAGQAEELLSKNSSATFRSYLASQGVTVKDAVRALGIEDIGSQQVRALYQNDNTKPLFNAVLEDGFREGFLAGGRSDQLVGQTISMDQMSYQYYTLENKDNDDLDLSFIGQGAPIPVVSIKLDTDHTIFVYKRGGGIEITDEAKAMRFDMLSLHLRKRGVQIGRTEEKLAVHRLLNGYFKDGTDAAPTLGVKTANDWTLADIWYAKQYAFQKYGFNYTKCLMNLKTAEKWATQKEANGNFIFLNELKNGDMPDVLDYQPFISEDIPDGRMVLVDPRFALAKYQFKPFSVENDRDVKTQVEGSYATETSDYIPFDPNARMILTLDAARS